MRYQAVPAQRELFSRAAPKTSLPSEVMQRILLLFEQLLAEAAAFDLSVTERIDEQDHA
jgi:hypothetical protein